jgi:hypothetical protein
MARVIALQAGHCGTAKREENEEFEIADARLLDGSTWFVAADPAVHARLVAEAAKKAKQLKDNPPGAGPKRGSKEQDPVPPGAGPRGKSADDLA